MLRVALVAVIRPPGWMLIITRPSPDLFGLIEATSNCGSGSPTGGWASQTPPANGSARTPAEVMAPSATGAMSTPADIIIRDVRFQPVSVRADRPPTIRSIRFVRFELATPATQATGEETLARQASMMLSA